MKWAGKIMAVKVVAAWLAAAGAARAQQATVATPYSGVRDGFFEHIGTSWGINAPGFTFRFGSPNLGSPPFGHYFPGAGATLGFGFRRNSATGFFNAEFSQGSQRSLTSQVPAVTLTQGIPGRVADSSVAPFVVGYVPVVGGCPTIPFVMLVPSTPALGSSAPGARSDNLDPRFGPGWSREVEDGPKARVDPTTGQAVLAHGRGKPGAVAFAGQRQKDTPADRQPRPSGSKPQAEPPGPSSAQKFALAQTSTAGRPVPSVAEAQAMRAAEEERQHAEAALYYERGLSAEAAGHRGAARIYYQMAARRASGEQKQKILQRLDALKSTESKPTDP